MHVADVEIFSDQTNAAIMRHPGRKFPGVLIQGDSLSILCSDADELCAKAKGVLSDDDYDDLNELRNSLRYYLTHYKKVLIEHGMRLPFSD